MKTLTDLKAHLAAATKGELRLTDDGTSIYTLDASGRVNRLVIHVSGGYADWTPDAPTRTPHDEVVATAKAVHAAVNALPALIEIADKAQMLVDHMHNGRAMVPSDVDRLRAALAALNAPAKEGG